MKCDRRTMLLYAVTDRAWIKELSLYEQVEQALQNGVTCVQLREKSLDKEAFLTEAIALARLCKQYHVPFIVNDNVEIALKCGADGIHVGQEDMQASTVREHVGEGMIIGVSVHTVAEALEAVKNGADYLGLGSVFPTSTKSDINLMSCETVKAICSTVNVPTVAIGGICRQNILKLSGSGIDGVAVVSAIFGAENPGAATAELLALAKQMVQMPSQMQKSLKGVHH